MSTSGSGIRIAHRTVYVNGEFVRAEDAKVSVFDRGFVFGDGVYEVIPVIRQRLMDRKHALERLDHSLSSTGIGWPCSREALIAVLEELLMRDDLQEGYVYLQITRGVAERDFALPVGAQQGLVAWGVPRSIIDHPLAINGVAVASVPDLRWKRRDIKSVNLLAQCLSKQMAVEQGGYEGWMIDEGVVTEGVTSSAFIVRANTLITRASNGSILPGIRRKVILRVARENDIGLQEREFTLEEACIADEAFMSSATTLVLPVVNIDGRTIGNGRPGPVTQKLRALYVQTLLEEAGVVAD
ncbi:MAG: D-amino-acid transaminase [Pseudomonadota bacterium]